MTSRMFSTCVAACILAVEAGTAVAEEDPDFVGPQPRNAATQPAAADANAASQREVIKDKDGYFAALDKCEQLQGVAEKQQCVDTVRKEYRQM